MLVLGIETSCDETSAAVVQDRQILSNVVSSQMDLHSVYGGVVPEVASRQHLRVVDAVIARACKQADISVSGIDAIAVTRGPGLPSALLVGVSTARGLALRWRKPLIPIHHMEAHLYSPAVEAAPFVALVVSGGHTLLVHVLRFGEHQLLGQTLDDAAGEAFDKAAQLMGLGYPGGPAIEQKAKNGNPKAFRFPRPMLDSGDWNFSFSGLKTALRRTVASLLPPLTLPLGKGEKKGVGHRQVPHLEQQQVADLCASFQAAVVEVLVEKTIRAAQYFQVSQVALSGGVACNHALRSVLEKGCQAKGIRLAVAERNLCTDNAAMIALLAARKLDHGFGPPSNWDIKPDWILSAA